MGQRHQVYIIAGNKVLAAFHWQWLFGQRAALSATRFINAAKNPVNAMIIEADIETYWETNNTIPCPYITWLYLHVVQHGVDHQDLGNCCPIDIDMDIQMIDNNDGITVIDLTCPRTPHYCMVSLGYLESRQEPKAHYQPMTAEEYVTLYYPCIVDEAQRTERDPPAEVIKAAYRGLIEIPLIDHLTLRETWPCAFRGSPKAASVRDYDIQPLRILAAYSVIDAAIDKTQYEWETATLTPDMRLHMLERLRSKSRISEVKFPGLPNLLGQLLSDTTFVDLSPFALTPIQTISLLKGLQRCQILRLKTLTGVSAALSKALQAMSSLRLLILFESDERSVQQLRIKVKGRFNILTKGDYASSMRTLDRTDDNYQVGGSSSPAGGVRPKFVLIGENRREYDSTKRLHAAAVNTLTSVEFILQVVSDALQYPACPQVLETIVSGDKRECGTLFCTGEFWRAQLPQTAWTGDFVQYVFAYAGVAERSWEGSKEYRYSFFQYRPEQSPRMMDLDCFLDVIREDLMPAALEGPTGEIAWLTQLKAILQDISRFKHFTPTEWSEFRARNDEHEVWAISKAVGDKEMAGGEGEAGAELFKDARIK